MRIPSGGIRIGMNVTEVLLGVLAFEVSPPDAVTRPGFNVVVGGSSPQLEQPWPSASVQQDLVSRGEQLVETSFPAAVQLIAIDPAGRFDPQADARKSGAAGVLRNP